MKDKIVETLQRGVNLSNNDQFDEAIGHFEKVIELKNALTQAIIQRGRCHWEMRRWKEAEQDFLTAYSMDPDNTDIPWTVSLMNLQMGKFVEASKTFEGRWQSKKFDSPRLKTKQPRWFNGSGYKDILVWSEQGIGDQILYCSLLRKVKEQTPEVTVMIDYRLSPLFERTMPDIKFIPQNAVVKEIDAQIPMGSIAMEFIKSIDDIRKFRTDPYLVPDYGRSSAIRAGLNLASNEKLIGISWQSGAPRIGNHKSAKLEEFMPVFNIPNTRFVSLQYGDHYEEIADLERQHGIRVELVLDVDNTVDIDGLAALINACDAVVTVSNVTGHIAGAVGTKTFLLDSNKLWYWNNTHGRENLWYSSVNTYRKATAISSWSSQIEDVRRDLFHHLYVKGEQPTFVFFRTGNESQIGYTRKFVQSLKKTNLNARIIMCTDAFTPIIEGTERFEMTLDCEDFMEYRLRIYAALGLKHPAMYLDDDMIVRSQIDPEKLLGDNRAVFCERSFDRDLQFNPSIKGLDFSEHNGRTMFQVFPFLACSTVTEDYTVWEELLAILDHIDPKYRKWYGDQEAMKIWTKMNAYGVLGEDEYACLPEHLSGRNPKIVHYKGARKGQMK